MKCLKCSRTDSSVIDSREIDEGTSIRRRRECDHCKFRFTTYERLEQPRLMVVKKDGSRELFVRDKLAKGIYKAFYKRPVPASQVEELIDDIEREIHESGSEEVASRDVGELVIKCIGEIDKVAYIRFAAVYRQFTDLETFETEIKKLIAQSQNKRQSK